MIDNWSLATPFSRKWKDCVLYLLVMMASYTPAAKPESIRDRSYSFSISAQPLGMALEDFSRATGLAVLLDSRYAGRASQGLTGSYPSDVALGYLLRNTGLKARWYEASRAFGIVADASGAVKAIPPSTAIAGVLSQGNNYFAYVGYVQQRLLGRLCQSNQARPGDYRLAMQFWIDGRGTINRAHMLDSTGNEQRDDVIIRIFQGFRLELIPAREMPQPVTILLQPDQANGVRSCADSLKAGG
jgi:hypothetical protein